MRRLTVYEAQCLAACEAHEGMSLADYEHLHEGVRHLAERGLVSYVAQEGFDGYVFAVRNELGDLALRLYRLCAAQPSF